MSYFVLYGQSPGQWKNNPSNNYHKFQVDILMKNIVQDGETINNIILLGQESEKKDMRKFIFKEFGMSVEATKHYIPDDDNTRFVICEYIY